MGVDRIRIGGLPVCGELVAARWGVKVTYKERLSYSAGENDAEYSPVVARERPPVGGVGPPVMVCSIKKFELAPIRIGPCCPADSSSC